MDRAAGGWRVRQIYSQIAFLVMAAVCGAALRWGGRLERRVAVLVATAWIGVLVAQRVLGEVAPVPVLAAMDVAVLGILLALSWGDRAGWTVYAVACQGVAVGVHAIRLFAPAMSTWTYLTALTASGYALLATLAWGTWAAWRARGLSS